MISVGLNRLQKSLLRPDPICSKALLKLESLQQHHESLLRDPERQT
jgi:hypothetical protein